MERYFGETPDLDIEEQRALLILKKPMKIDWKAVADMIKRANYTFGGTHLRMRGRVLEQDAGGSNKKLTLELVGPGQSMEIKNPDRIRSSIGKTVEVVARVVDWKEEARLVVLDAP